MSLCVFAPAKVNLYLHVVGKRADGYHLLDSLAVFPRIGDDVRAETGEGLSLTIDGPTGAGLAADADNIVLKAARALADYAGITPQASLHLTKRLPIASGIGGGSADGAATLRALCQLWSLAVPEEDLAALALKIGADLPVCLRGRPTRMEGIGEILTDVPALPDAWMVLANPGVGVATPAVFRARTAPFSAPAPITGPIPNARTLADALAQRGNDLMAPAISLVPVIADVLQALANRPGCLLSRMSGSGATCFALFTHQDQAQEAERALRHDHPDWWTASAQM